MDETVDNRYPDRVNNTRKALTVFEDGEAPGSNWHEVAQALYIEVQWRGEQLTDTRNELHGLQRSLASLSEQAQTEIDRLNQQIDYLTTTDGTGDHALTKAEFDAAEASADVQEQIRRETTEGLLMLIEIQALKGSQPQTTATTKLAIVHLRRALGLDPLFTEEAQ